MHWLELTHNPLAIKHLYDEVPPLENMELIDLHINQNGPKLKLKMNFPRFADHRPERWNKKDNTVHIELDFWSISDLEIKGFTSTPMLDFSVEKTDQRILVIAQGQGIRLRFNCGTIYIQKVSGYIKLEEPPMQHT
jgi:hypothetical protein